jgi:multidrug efflux pump subunit AcrA (membrane-fusion protein)
LIHDGAAARVMVPSLGEREFDGKVTRSSFALDPQARTLRVQIEVPNPDGELRPGNYAKARITAERPQVLTAPVSAVILRDDQAFVVRVEDGKAVWTPVKLGQRNGESVELLKKQTQPAGADGRRTWESWTGAEEIVRSNPSALTDGQVVRVEAVPAVVAQVMDTR